MAPRQIRPDQLAQILPPGGLTWLQACSAESPLIRGGLISAGDSLGAMTFTGIFVPGLNRVDYALTGVGRVKTFFMTPELSQARDRVEFLPLCYRDILATLRSLKFDAALTAVSLPDEKGFCSFGPVADFLVDLWRRIPLRVAHINPRIPRTTGEAGIPFAELTAVIEGDAELPVSSVGRDEASDKIGTFVSELVPDGATIQAGLGRIPETAVASLHSHRGLSIHSGLVGDSALDLLAAGTLREGRGVVTAGVAIGSRRLYDAIGDEAFCFRSVSHTHSLRVLGRIDNLFTINSAIEVDLFGQAYSELTPRGLVSGPGGASDFAAGARDGGGLRIVALPATAEKGLTSRIVGPGAAGPMALGRFDIDVVVTEFGAADLRGRGHDERAEALMAIAAPSHQAMLSAAWREWRNGKIKR
jgi:acyl-CoA hydrolase